MLTRDEQRVLKRGALWAVTAINTAIQDGKVLDNQLPEVLAAIENKLIDHSAADIGHRLPEIVAEAIRDVQNEEFVPLD